MAFNRVERRLPPRLWALIGSPVAGKSTFLQAMRQPTLLIDCDGRRHELQGGDLFELSDHAEDHRNPRRIEELLRANMPNSGVRTIGVDSVTAYLGSSTASAMLANADGVNKNKNTAWVDKSQRMSLLQNAVTAWGTDVAYIWHVLEGQLDGKAVMRETLPATERQRLMRNLNAIITLFVQDGRRGARIEWSRRGPCSTVIWDEPGKFWVGVPEAIEQAIYGNAPAFRSPQEAIAWAVTLGAYANAEEAQESYRQLRERIQPDCAATMFEAWQGMVREQMAREPKVA